jgi:D-alanyl-D-alanine carboxypeptidase (penicillin-binding protein 5/6)
MKQLILFALVLTGTLAEAQQAVTIVPAAPDVNATAYLVMDYNSGRILAEKEIDKRVEPASLTKMMTTYVVTEELDEGNIRLTDMVKVSEKAWRMEGSRMFIEVNKEVSIEDLLKGVIIQSGNDASVALAEHIAGSEEVFASVMNQYAAKLGMTSTNFTNSTGLPDENMYTTARDLATLAVAKIRDHADIYAWHAIKEFTYNGITQPNRNLLLWRDESVDGIKTGHTDAAGYCLVVSAERDGMRLISVVMGSDGMESRARASAALLGYAFRFFETQKLYSSNEIIDSAKVWKGEAGTLNLGVNEDVWVTAPRGQFRNIKPLIELEPMITAPVMKNSVLGKIKIMLGDELIADRPLVALESIEQGGLVDRLMDEIRLLFQ